MQSISIITNPTTENLVGRSHWWGAPDLPEDVPYPYVMVDDTQVVMGSNGMPKRDIHGNVIIEHGEDYPEPLTFICQIRMEDVAPFDKEGLLPRKGMLYFFAAIDYFLGDSSPIEIPLHGPVGDMVRVIYVDDVPDDVQPYDLHWEDTGESIFRPAEEITFYEGVETSDTHALLSIPYQDEVSDSYPRHIALLQVEEDDRWGLHFFDCGSLYLLIRPEDLKARRFDNLQCEVFTY